MRRPIRSGVIGLIFMGISLLILLIGMLVLVGLGIKPPDIFSTLVQVIITGIFAFMAHPSESDKARDAAAQESTP